MTILATLAQAVTATDANVVSWVQAGGLALFSACVWYELRQQRAERAAQAKAQADRDDKLDATMTLVHGTLEVLRDRAGFKSGPIRSPTARPGEVPILTVGADRDRGAE